MYVCIHMCIYIYICMCAYTCVYIYIYACMCACHTDSNTITNAEKLCIPGNNHFLDVIPSPELVGIHAKFDHEQYSGKHSWDLWKIARIGPHPWLHHGEKLHLLQSHLQLNIEVIPSGNLT